jgi:hypothetical protein
MDARPAGGRYRSNRRQQRPDVIADQRFRLVCGTPGDGLLYPPLAPGQSGLAKKSFAPIDELRSIDKRRIRRVFGELAPEEMTAIDEGRQPSLASAAGLNSADAPAVQ